MKRLIPIVLISAVMMTACNSGESSANSSSASKNAVVSSSAAETVSSENESETTENTSAAASTEKQDKTTTASSAVTDATTTKKADVTNDEYVATATTGHAVDATEAATKTEQELPLVDDPDVTEAFIETEPVQIETRSPEPPTEAKHNDGGPIELPIIPIE